MIEHVFTAQWFAQHLAEHVVGLVKIPIGAASIRICEALGVWDYCRLPKLSWRQAFGVAALVSLCT
jgi:hypothetical protein